MADKQKQSMDETFTIANAGDNDAQVRRVLEELSSASVTHYNFQKFFDKWRNTRQIISAQIENEYSQYVQELETYRELKDQPRIKSALENRVAPLDIYDAVLKMHFRARQVVSWKFIEAELSRIFAEKIILALQEVKAIDVEREVLTRIQEMEKNRNELFLEIMTTRFDAMDSKFLAGLKVLQENSRVDNKENLQLLANALVTASQVNQETISGFAKAIRHQQLQPAKGAFEFDFDESIKPLSNALNQEKANVSEQLQSLQKKAQPKDVTESIKNLEADLAATTKKKEKPARKEDDKLLGTTNPKDLFSDEVDS